LLEAKRQSEFNAPQIPVTIYKAGETFEVGPFRIEAIPVAHSIPEPVALAITTPAGTVIHTGDWRIDLTPEIGPPTNEARLRARRPRRVGADLRFHQRREGRRVAIRTSRWPEPEKDHRGSAKGRVAVTTFSSNVGRVRSIAEAARDAGRQVLVLGRSLKRVISVSEELGYMEGIPPFVAEEDYMAVAREKPGHHLHRQPGRAAGGAGKTVAR
jgi:ribonuclease J